MPKAPYIEDHKLKHLLKVAAVSGELPVRNVALLTCVYGTGMMLAELARLPVRSYIKADDWSEHGTVDWDSDDSDQNELHPRILLENAAKAQEFMLMRCAEVIQEIEPSLIISGFNAPTKVVAETNKNRRAG